MHPDQIDIYEEPRIMFASRIQDINKFFTTHSGRIKVLQTALSFASFTTLIVLTIRQAQAINGTQCLLCFEGEYVRHTDRNMYNVTAECKDYYIFSSDYSLSDPCPTTTDRKYLDVFTIDLYQDDVATPAKPLPQKAKIVTTPSVYRNLAIAFAIFCCLQLACSLLFLVSAAIKSDGFFTWGIIFQLACVNVPVFTCQVVYLLSNSKPDSPAVTGSLAMVWILISGQTLRILVSEYVLRNPA